MKAFRILLAVAIMCFTLGANAQNVKIKKGMAYVDDELYLDLSDCDSYACTYKSVQGIELFSIQYESFEKKNPFARNPKSKAPYSSTVTEHYAIVNFMEFDLEFETDLTSKKKFIEALYKNEVVSDEGTIDQEKAKRFIKKYGKDVSGNRPLQLITN